MHRRSLVIIGLLLALALPLSASQFIDMPFDQVAREAQYVVRGTIEQTFTAWDDAHQVIYTYATVRVTRHFGERGPQTLVVREVGGTVDGYTQEAIGFPMIRTGEDVVMMLSPWDDSPDFRIQAFNQGKYLVRNRGGVEVLVQDPVQQGDERLGGRHGIKVQGDEVGLTIREFARMVDDARAGAQTVPGRQQQQ